MVRDVKGAEGEETARNRPDRTRVQTNEGVHGHGCESEIEILRFDRDQGIEYVTRISFVD